MLSGVTEQADQSPKTSVTVWTMEQQLIVRQKNMAFVSHMAQLCAASVSCLLHISCSNGDLTRPVEQSGAMFFQLSKLMPQFFMKAFKVSLQSNTDAVFTCFLIQFLIFPSHCIQISQAFLFSLNSCPLYCCVNVWCIQGIVDRKTLLNSANFVPKFCNIDISPKVSFILLHLWYV